MLSAVLYVIMLILFSFAAYTHEADKRFAAAAADWLAHARIG